MIADTEAMSVIAAFVVGVIKAKEGELSPEELRNIVAMLPANEHAVIIEFNAILKRVATEMESDITEARRKCN